MCVLPERHIVRLISVAAFEEEVEHVAADFLFPPRSIEFDFPAKIRAIQRVSRGINVCM